MSVVVIGIEHQQAPLEVLERVSMGEQEVVKLLATVHGRDNVAEAVVLSTCLRTEVYAVVDRFHEAVDDVRELLSGHAGLPLESVEGYSAVRFDDDVAAHLFAVAAGLASAIPGESEILGQVRRAWERARDERASGPVLGELFRHAVQTGKRVRSQTAIARGTTSFSHAAVELAEGRRAGGLSGVRLLVVGAGEMGAGLVQAVCGLPAARRPAEVVVANRTPVRARELAAGAPRHLSVRAAPMSALLTEVGVADVVLSAVEAGGHVLPATAFSERAGAGTGLGDPRPVLVIDLGVPRNVDPDAGSLPGVTLLDMDDLRTAVERAVEDRRAEAQRAAVIVGEELDRYRTATRARAAAPVIAALRARTEELRSAELDRQRRQLPELGPEAWTTMDEVTRAVLAKVLHEPTVLLRDTSGTARGERLVEALRTLFNL